MTSKNTTVVNVRKSEYDVLIDRKTIFGNPFVIGKDGTRDEVINMFREWVVTQPELIKEIKKLKGKVLGCHCRPDKKCHGDVIAEIADSIVDEEFI